MDRLKLASEEKHVSSNTLLSSHACQCNGRNLLSASIDESELVAVLCSWQKFLLQLFGIYLFVFFFSFFVVVCYLVFFFFVVSAKYRALL